MTLQEICQGLETGIANMSWMEGLAVLFSVISVLCARANNVWLYPAGIAGILLSIYIFIGAEYKLYPDAALNVYYLLMSIYGWYFWLKKPASQTGEDSRPARETPITWCTKKELIIAAALFTVLWTALYWWLSTYKINNVPLMDSFSSAMAATGMWLLAKRKIENWLALLIADTVAVALFFVKNLLLFSTLNVFYIVVAILGFMAWKRRYHRATGEEAR